MRLKTKVAVGSIIAIVSVLILFSPIEPMNVGPCAGCIWYAYHSISCNISVSLPGMWYFDGNITLGCTGPGFPG